MTGMNKKNTPLLDEHLESLKGMQAAEAGDFFYTRLRQRMVADMQRNAIDKLWRFPLKPVWTVSLLVILLGVNGFMLTQQFRNKHISSNSNNSAIKNFAESYDQTVTTTY